MCIASRPVSLPLPMFPIPSACPLRFLQWQNHCRPPQVSWHLWLAAELQEGISHKCARWLRHKGGTTSTNQAVDDLEASRHPPSRSHITAFPRCHSPFPCLHKVPRRMWPGAVQYRLNLRLQFSKSLEMSLQAVSKQISGFPLVPQGMLLNHLYPNGLIRPNRCSLFRMGSCA